MAPRFLITSGALALVAAVAAGCGGEDTATETGSASEPAGVR